MKSPLLEAVQACAVALLGGVVLHADDVTAGNGVVIDWREVKHGETLQNDGDAFDTAYLFVTVVGVEAAHAAAVGADRSKSTGGAALNVDDTVNAN